uniref:Guanylate cyclase n=1 Tax=Syphacia muris TaxID=451379 RepID=A0A0N5AUD5_9BILA
MYLLAAVKNNFYVLFLHVTFKISGWSGNFNINSNGYRNPIYSIYGLSPNLEETIYANILMNSTGIVSIYSFKSLVAVSQYLLIKQMLTLDLNLINTLKKYKKNKLLIITIPVCDFDNSGCPPAFMELYGTYIILGIVIIVVVLILLMLSISYVIRLKENGQKSTYSLQSVYTTASNPTVIDSNFKDSKSHVFMYLHGEPVVAIKHISRPKITKNDAIRQHDKNNLNKFLGLCTDGTQYLSIWKYCSRGSLKDVIEKGTLNIDSFFMLCIMRDIIEGLYYIHNSIVEFHGHLTSASCLVDERWQVKINDYGLRFIKELEERPEKTLLWTAPELLREGNNVGSKEGDIYSFAIICSEIVTKKLAFNYLDREESVEGKKTSKIDLELIQECWSEDPKARPKKIELVNIISRNLFDHVFNMMEEYAQNLENEVEQRTRELVEEQKKSDLLLYRMLPKQVAELLKLGKTVAPESFDAATVFFSDVVKFTELARRCTPLQVVNLLNELYTIFDNIIEECGVYKVETIGDGYLCVSGLPRRNGNDHAKEVAEMSFQFLRKLKLFRVPHLPDEQVKIRIGIHTGPVVAGIIGQTMPRYCLFGDTVNTASRMESNGKCLY